MKTIGLIGGMSWESTAEYYRIINETVKEKIGGLHSAKIVMYSVDFAEIERLQHEEKWDEAISLMIDAAKRVESAGNESEREIVHNVIYKELCLGEVKDSSRERVKTIINRLSDYGAQGIILGCTELPLLIKQEDCSIPLFDTTVIHANAAVDYALKD